jgi:peptide/nickel transport system permease protein
VASPLLRYVARRLLSAVLLIFLASSGALLLARLAPGDANLDLIGTASATTLARERAAAELDRPALDQYRTWLARALQFDLGRSSRYGLPVRDLVRERGMNTVVLAFTALLTATLIGIPLGVFSGTGVGRGRQAVRVGSTVILSVPPLVTALLLAFAASRTGWFPVGGMQSGGEGLVHRLWHLVLPSLALALPIAATLERLQSAAMRDQLQAQHVRAARARGVPDARVIWRHVFRNALGPLLGIYGIVIGGLFSGSFGVEMVMAWPGLGRLMYDALLARDVYLVAGCAIAGTMALVAGTFVADLALAWADPRVLEAS